jgi:hypothetical protein
VADTDRDTDVADMVPVTHSQPERDALELADLPRVVAVAHGQPDRRTHRRRLPGCPHLRRVRPARGPLACRF